MVSGSGLVAFAQSGAGVSDGPRFVPADAPIYVEARLDMPDGQGEAAGAAADGLPRLRRCGQLPDRSVDEVIDSLLE